MTYAALHSLYLLLPVLNSPNVSAGQHQGVLGAVAMADHIAAFGIAPACSNKYAAGNQARAQRASLVLRYFTVFVVLHSAYVWTALSAHTQTHITAYLSVLLASSDASPCMTGKSKHQAC